MEKSTNLLDKEILDRLLQLEDKVQKLINALDPYFKAEIKMAGVNKEEE